MQLPLIIIFWYIFPVVVLFASRYVVTRFSLNERYRVKAPDLATPFFFIGIYALSTEAFQRSAVPYFLIVVLLIGIAVALTHARYYGDIQYKRFFKMFWRITFLVTLVLYGVLIVASAIHYL